MTALTSASFPKGIPDIGSEAEARSRISMLSVIQRGAEAVKPQTLCCPWCGSEPGLATVRAGRYLVGCESDDCDVNPQTGGGTEIEAWARWNTRVAK